MSSFLEQTLLSENPAYLLTMTEAYFSMPGMSGFNGSSIKRTATWQLKKLKNSLQSHLKLR